ncbi:MAG: hypothetical protein EBS42_16400, partial [Caulobacteraceae bacterium]|nr:hypothetical protein [Caulobacteraceae bacterium]
MRRKTMADLKSETLTARQKAWFASIRSNLERETGRSLEDWVVVGDRHQLTVGKDGGHEAAEA